MNSLKDWWHDVIVNGERGTARTFNQWLFNVGLAVSQVLSAILGGDPDESISSRSGKAARAGKPVFVNYVCPFLDKLLMEKDHCLKSIEDDEKGRLQIWDWSK